MGVTELFYKLFQFKVDLAHRDYKRIEASSRYKFSQARGSN